MLNNIWRKTFISSILLVYFLMSFTYSIYGTEQVCITLQDAINLAFQENPQYRLDQWEHVLREKEKELSGNLRPTIAISTKPLHISNGDIHSPAGEFNLTIPFNDDTSLTSKLSIVFSEGTIKTEPNTEVKFQHRLFSPRKIETKSTLEPEIKMENDLILSITQLLINLSKSLDNLAVEQVRLEFYQQSHEKASLGEVSVEIERAIQNISNSEQKIADFQQALNEYNQEISYFLNQKPILYNPIINFTEHELNYQPEIYIEKILAFDSQLVAAENSLAMAENELTAIKQSMGWNVTSSASLELNPQKQDALSWSVGINASKQLYPKELITEQQELKIAQAKLNLDKIKQTVVNQAERLLQSLIDNKERKNKAKERIIRARQDLEDTQLRFLAGLATKLNLVEKQLNLNSIEIELKHLHYDYLYNTLQLYHKSGYRLLELLPQLIVQGGV